MNPETNPDLVGWLVYHPARQKTNLGQFNVYHDAFGERNQDPYIWNERFLHTYCHYTQMSHKRGQVNFWVSGDTYPFFNKLFCDCVFVEDLIVPWDERNSIDANNHIVDTEDTFNHHYKWVTQHPFKGTKRPKNRYTSKAQPDFSFQAQNEDGSLIDIVPYLNSLGLTNRELQNRISLSSTGEKLRQSKPTMLPAGLAQDLYQKLSLAPILIKGSTLQGKHPHSVQKNTFGVT